MANTYEKNLSAKTTLTTSDYIRVVGSDNVSYKQGVSSVISLFTSNMPTTEVTVTAADNVVIDVNKSYKMGKLLMLIVKGHTTAIVNNAVLFTLDNATFSPSNYTFAIGLGSNAWDIDSAGYGYTGANSVTGKVASGRYFHIAQFFFCTA